MAAGAEARARAARVEERQAKPALLGAGPPFATRTAPACIVTRGRPSSPPARRGVTVGSIDTKTLIESYNDAWNRQDLDDVCSFHADEIVFENHTAGERAEGADAVRAHIGGIFERWPTLRFSARAFYPAADFAVCEWTAQAVRDDGQRIEWDGVDVFPLRDGKILRKDVYSTSQTPRVLGTAT